MVSLPSFDFLFTLLLLVPGFVGYKIARRVGKVTIQLDRFEKSIYTIIGSGASFAIFVILYSAIDDTVVSDIFSTEYTIVQLSLGYVGILTVSIIGGIIVGVVTDKIFYRGKDIRSERTWQILAEGWTEPAEVWVVMNNGEEFWGQIQISDSEPHGQDLVLKYPQKIIRDDSGEIQNRVNIGEYIFVSENELSHIIFESEILF